MSQPAMLCFKVVRKNRLSIFTSDQRIYKGTQKFGWNIPVMQTNIPPKRNRSLFDQLVYKKGAVVRAHMYDWSNKECTAGIHVYMTRKEAEDNCRLDEMVIDVAAKTIRGYGVKKHAPCVKVLT